MPSKNGLITSREMRALEVNAEYYGMSLLQLMENAGRKIAEETISRFPNSKNVVVFCGLGGNGGDGFVAARHLLQPVAMCQLFLRVEAETFTMKQR